MGAVIILGPPWQPGSPILIDLCVGRSSTVNIVIRIEWMRFANIWTKTVQKPVQTLQTKQRSAKNRVQILQISPTQVREKNEKKRAEFLAVKLFQARCLQARVRHDDYSNTCSQR